MKVELVGISGVPEITAGDDLAAILLTALGAAGAHLEAGDIVVITQKVVSKSEGRAVVLASVVPSPFAQTWAAASGVDPRVVELVLRESRRIVRMDRGVLIAETHHGLVCANAGVDLSNVANVANEANVAHGEVATLLPADPDASATRLLAALTQHVGVPLAVIISDTFGRPWREGLTNVAIGTAGLAPLESYVGAHDPHGRELRATIHATADEIAAAAGLVSTKLNRIPAVVVRGLGHRLGRGSARELVRRPDRDMFR